MNDAEKKIKLIRIFSIFVFLIFLHNKLFFYLRKKAKRLTKFYNKKENDFFLYKKYFPFNKIDLKKIGEKIFAYQTLNPKTKF